MNNTIKITFGLLSEEQTGIIIAELSVIGFEGFDTTNNVLEAFIPEDEFEETALQEICGRYNISAEKNIIAHENWNKLWESNFEPVLADDFCCIRADFHPPAKNVQFDLVINPKMSFGTGHHATTYMMIQLMRDISFREKTVCDFGTGTGVLAILAEKMGAVSLLAVDYDEQCMINAAENIAENGCDRIQPEQHNRLPDGKWDIILANINLNVLCDNMSAFNNSLTTGGMLLLSGILETDVPAITQVMNENNLKINKLLTRNGWSAILAGRLIQGE